ncbi:MAG: nuclear transport factor 2 family protein [Acidimicrobiia bacterium]|nr:nuclear transport factor 2 family protein [Acidimicrobiia bacterium]
MDAIQDQIEAIYREYGESVVAGDIDRWASLWVEDGVQMPPGFPMNVGLEAITRWLRAQDIVFLSFEIAPPTVEVFGDLALAHGTYRYLAELAGENSQISWDGKFLTVFRRQDDGAWKIYRDVFNSNVPTI